jgi:hypothetical protein
MLASEFVESFVFFPPLNEFLISFDGVGLIRFDASAEAAEKSGENIVAILKILQGGWITPGSIVVAGHGT